jgi:hypothetical protein
MKNIIITLLLILTLASISQAQRKVKAKITRDCPAPIGLRMNATPSPDLLRLRDDSNPNQTLIISQNGDYTFSRGVGALQASGTGTVRLRGCFVTLEDATARFRIKASGDACNGTGTATLSYPRFGVFSIRDSQKYKSEEK